MHLTFILVNYYNYFNFRQIPASKIIFSIVRMADLICVMKEGRIFERGSHEELISAGSRYAQLYNMQAQYYR